jgi:hypothetical protein
MFIENYGFITEYYKPKLYYDAGMAFLLNNHIQIDISAGAKIDSDNDYFIVNAGFAWQFVGKKMKF